MQKVNLTRRQRLSVNYFQRYTINDKEIERQKANPRGMSVNRIVSECDALHSEVDKRILYELTGIKVDQEAFKDDSSFEADLSQMVDNLIGYDERLISMVVPSDS